MTWFVGGQDTLFEPFTSFHFARLFIDISYHNYAMGVPRPSYLGYMKKKNGCISIGFTKTLYFHGVEKTKILLKSEVLPEVQISLFA